MASKWIQEAIKKPGSFKKYAEKGKMGMKEAISKGKKSKNPTTKRRANLAETLRKLGKKRKKAKKKESTKEYINRRNKQTSFGGSV